MISVFDTDVITVVRPTYINDLGNEYEDWTNPVRTDIPNCAIQGGESREDHNRADGVTADFTIWAPIDADVNKDDRLDFTYGGRQYTDYQVDGTPTPLVDPLNILSHLVIRVTKREG